MSLVGIFKNLPALEVWDQLRVVEQEGKNAFKTLANLPQHRWKLSPKFSCHINMPLTHNQHSWAGRTENSTILNLSLTLRSPTAFQRIRMITHHLKRIFAISAVGVTSGNGLPLSVRLSVLVCFTVAGGATPPTPVKAFLLNDCIICNFLY